MSKRDNRIEAIQLLYTVELNECKIDEAILMFDEIIISEEAIIYAKGVMNRLESIDNYISNALTNYSIYRLNYVDKAIIRLATFEILEGVAPSIAINEALEITKIYSDQGDRRAVAFNNKLLDKIKSNILG